MIRRENDLILSQWYCLWFDLHNRCRQNGAGGWENRSKTLSLYSPIPLPFSFPPLPLSNGGYFNLLEWFSYDLEMKTRKQNRNSKRTDTNARVKKLHVRELSRWWNDALLRRYTATGLANRTMPSPIHIRILWSSAEKRRVDLVLNFSSIGL